MSARPPVASPRAALRLGVCLGLVCLGGLACEDQDVTYEGTFANDLTAAEQPAESACVPKPSTCPAEVPSYSGEVAGIIERHCGSCHDAATPTGPWPFDNWQDVSDWTISLRIALEQCLMPPPETDAPLSDEDRDKLQAWLACGAPNN